MKELVFQYLDLIVEDYTLYKSENGYILINPKTLKWCFEYNSYENVLWMKTSLMDDIATMFNIDYGKCREFIKEWGEDFFSAKITGIPLSNNGWILYILDTLKASEIITEETNMDSKIQDIVYEYITLITEDAELLVDHGKNPVPGEYRIHFLNTKDKPPVKWFFVINSIGVSVGVSLKFIQEVSSIFGLDEDISEKIIRNWYEDFLSEKVDTIMEKEKNKKGIKEETDKLIYLRDNKKMREIILKFLDTLLADAELVHSPYGVYNRESKWILDAKKEEWYVKCSPDYSNSYKINPILVDEVIQFFGENIRDIPYIIRLWSENIIGYKHGKTEVNANIGYDAIDEAIAIAKEGKGIKISELINKNIKENKMNNILITKEQLSRLIGETKKPITEHAGAKLTCTYSNYDKLDQFLGNKEQKKIGNNTFITRIDEFTISVKLHYTHIIKIDPTDVMTLNDGGFMTNLTKHRLTEFLRCRGVYIYSKKGIWILKGGNGEFEFKNGIKITADGFIVEV